MAKGQNLSAESAASSGNTYGAFRPVFSAMNADDGIKPVFIVAGVVAVVAIVFLLRGK